MPLPYLIACLFVVCAVLSFALALAGVLIGLVFRLLPIVLIVLAVLFFVQGGKVNVDLKFPDSWRRK